MSKTDLIGPEDWGINGASGPKRWSKDRIMEKSKMKKSTMIRNGIAAGMTVALLAAGQTFAAQAPAKRPVAKRVATKKAVAKKATAQRVRLTNTAPAAATPNTAQKKKNAEVIQTSSAAPTSAAAIPAQTSTTTTPVAKKSFRDIFSMKYSIAVFGPAVSSPLSGYQPDLETGTNSTSQVSSENALAFRFKLSDKVTLAPTLFWFLTAGGGEQVGSGQTFGLYDPYVTLSHSALYSAGTYNVSGYLRGYAPTATVNQNANLLPYFRANLTQAYEIPNSRWSVELPTFVQWYPRTNTSQVIGSDAANPKKGVIDGKTGVGKDALRLYMGPAVNYKVSDSFTAGVLFEAEARTAYGKGTGGDTFHKEWINLEPNVSWDVTKALNVGLWLDFAIGKGERRMELDTTRIGGSLGWTIL